MVKNSEHSFVTELAITRVFHSQMILDLPSAVYLDLIDEETRALLNLLVEAIEADRYPLSTRVELLRQILSKFGEMGGLPPDLAQKLQRYAPPPPARPPTPRGARSATSAATTASPGVNLLLIVVLTPSRRFWYFIKMGGLGSGRGSGGPRPGGGRPRGSANQRTLASDELVRRRKFKTPLELMLEIINNPETSEERCDRMIVAATPYLHCKPSTPLFADNACKRYLNGSTSLTG